jgi:predicted GIY-YIG superfamily endonuclease
MFIIYKIEFENNDCYVGHTNNLNRRMIQHKCSSKRDKYKDYPLYINLRDITHNYIILESIECDKKTAFELEQKYMDLLKPNLNQKNAKITKQITRERNRIRMAKIYENKTDEEKLAYRKKQNDNRIKLKLSKNLK